MGLKCSVLGHQYGESAVEREREEQGSEVVITIRELETCQRCGNTRVVSENKEVTAVETPDDDLEEATGETDASDSTDRETTPSADADQGAEIVDAEADDTDEDGSDTGDTPGEPGGSDEIPDAEEISAAGAGASESADPQADDGIILEDEDEDADEATEQRQPGEWPEESSDDDEEWAPETAPAEDEPSVEPTSSAVTVPDGTFECTECSFTTDVDSSSLREGDFCPECHRGTLVHEGGNATRKE